MLTSTPPLTDLWASTFDASQGKNGGPSLSPSLPPNSPGSGVWPPMQVSVPLVQVLGEGVVRAACPAPLAPHPRPSCPCPSRLQGSYQTAPRWCTDSPLGITEAPW